MGHKKNIKLPEGFLVPSLALPPLPPPEPKNICFRDPSPYIFPGWPKPALSPLIFTGDFLN